MKQNQFFPNKSHNKKGRKKEQTIIFIINSSIEIEEKKGEQNKRFQIKLEASKHFFKTTKQINQFGNVITYN